MCAFQLAEADNVAALEVAISKAEEVGLGEEELQEARDRLPGMARAQVCCSTNPLWSC